MGPRRRQCVTNGMFVPSESVKRTRRPDGFQIILEIATFPLMYNL